MAPDKLGKKSRKEKRKEARGAKKQKKFESWIHHQQSEKLNKPSRDSKQKNISKLKNDGHFSEQRKVVPTDVNNRNSYSLVEPSELQNFEEELDGLGDLETCGLKSRKTRRHSCRSSKTKFEEYLEMDLQQAGASAEEDMKLESKLAKKLKVKDGKLGADDALDSILEVSPSVFDTLKGESNPRAEEDASRKGFENGPSSKNHRKSKSNKVKVDGQIDDEGAYDVGVQLVASCEEHEMSETSKIELVSSKDPNSVPVKAAKRKKTKFEEYLEMSLQEGIVSAKEDLGLERKLAKKLRVKEGKLKGDYDEFNMLLEGIPSVLDSLEDEGISAAEEALTDVLQKKKSCRKQKKMRLEKQEQDMKMACENDVGKLKSMETSGTEVISDKVPTKSPMSGANTMYVAPHLRSRVENESEEHSRFRKMVRGLLNRLSESNLEKITGEISTMFHSVGRNAGTQIISELVLVSCSGGPRGNKQYAAVFAAFVAGMASSVGIDFGAKIIASLAKSFEDEHLEEDNLSLRNLTLLLSYLYILGVCSSDLIYDFLIMLSERLTEIDVSIILTVLECAGMKLRGDDPIAMKNFVLNVQSGVNELKATSANDDAKHSKRMEFMLETICDIKNNKRRSDDDTVHLTQIKKWLQKLGVDNILIRGLKWAKLLDPNKKGQWWLSGDMASATENIEEVASKIDREVPETQKMLQLAAAQRMTTDARKAIFCIIMSGEDYIDAFEKLLRLELPGKQDREIMRVLVDCCLQEKVFNKYYCVLASKLCSHDKNHKFTLQYCLWDHFKELDSMVLMRSMHLAKFVAEMLASFSLSLAVLKVVDLGDPTQLTPKRIMHFRILFEAIFENSDTLVWNIFTRIALTPEYETLRSSIEFFIKNYVVSSQNSLVNKFKVAKKALNNVEGVIW